MSNALEGRKVRVKVSVVGIEFGFFELVWLDLHALSEHQSILDINAEITNCRLDLGMPEQNLDSAQIACLFVDEGCLRPAQRMRAVFLRAQPDRRHPLIHEPCILPRAEMPGWIAAAGKDEIIERPTPPF
jgi:hypothetical protein